MIEWADQLSVDPRGLGLLPDLDERTFLILAIAAIALMVARRS